MSRVLIVDDEAGVRFALGELLDAAGYAVVEVSSGEGALDALEAGDIDVVVTDLAMPGVDGLELMRRIRQGTAPVPVIVLTARGSEAAAVAALRGGAWDYLTKPFDADVLRAAVARAAEVSGLRRTELQARAADALGFPLVAAAPAMTRVLELVARVAVRDVTVLLRGATGTGKEVVATLLHAWSGRADAPLVRFNCAALPEDLAESELFGHARGAFTGAGAARVGFFERADGGTLVLDEVGELSPGAQAKLLRVLQDGEIQPVGASAVRRVAVRVVASTNRDLAAEVRAGRFREDLYYRLAVVELVIPALAARREDVRPLALAAARRHAARFGIAAPRLSEALLLRLEAREWPGNVRELDNAVARMVALCEPGAELGPEAMDDLAAAGDEASLTPTADDLRSQLEAFERAVLAETLAATDGNRSEAARRLGISRSTLIDKLRRFDLG